MSLLHYEKHAEEYFRATVQLPPPAIVEVLVEHLADGSSILDLGCGSGRDMAFLSSVGFCVTGIEQSPSLASLAHKHSGCEVIVGDFQTHPFDKKYDAVVSLGSFVHANRQELGSMITLMGSLLSKRGYAVVSLKKGSGVIEDGMRKFTLWDDSELREIFRLNHLLVCTFQETQSSLNKSDVWLSYLLQECCGSDEQR